MQLISNTTTFRVLVYNLFNNYQADDVSWKLMRKTPEMRCSWENVPSLWLFLRSREQIKLNWYPWKESNHTGKYLRLVCVSPRGARVSYVWWHLLTSCERNTNIWQNLPPPPPLLHTLVWPLCFSLSRPASSTDVRTFLTKLTTSYITSYISLYQVSSWERAVWRCWCGESGAGDDPSRSVRVESVRPSIMMLLLPVKTCQSGLLIRHRDRIRPSSQTTHSWGNSLELWELSGSLADNLCLSLSPLELVL